jgi:hypothetical protein
MKATAEVYMAQARIKLLFDFIEVDSIFANTVMQLLVSIDTSVEFIEIKDNTVFYNPSNVVKFVQRGGFEDVGPLALKIKEAVDLFTSSAKQVT